MVVMTLAAPVSARTAESPVAARDTTVLTPVGDVTWHPCDGVPGARCGSIERPLDPGDPAGAAISVAFELHPATDRTRATLGTIVAVEGGPGYPSTGSRDYYIDLFAPLMSRRDLLLVDARGTGASALIDCPGLESYEGDYIENVTACGAQLGDTADLYGTAFAADDLAAVLDALGIARVDLYGDSYGTFFGQTFAIRHPGRVRTLTLDASYPVADQDPWYRDINEAIRDAFRFVCARDSGCDAIDGDVVDRLAALADALRAAPLSGQAYDGDGVLRDVTIDAPFLSYLAGVATYGTTVYEELDGAGRAWLERGDPAPLLRIAAEQTDWSEAGDPPSFSWGQYVAVTCNDYPQLWDITAPLDERRDQFEASVAALRAADPDAFAPFTFDDWLQSPWTEYESCIGWPVPDAWVPPVDSPTVYPDLPTLVLGGDLDSITSSDGGRIVAGNFPGATFVQVANVGHVTALSDHGHCASRIVVAFVATGAVGDTSCAARYPEVRTTDEFPASVRDVDVPAGRGSARSRQVAAAAVATVGDVFPRWYAMLGSEGVGLRGGTFGTNGLDFVGFRLRQLRFVDDLAVSGRVTWNRRSGIVDGEISCGRSADCELAVRWDADAPGATARVTGTVDGVPIALTLPAP